jgi:threonine dehydrogenase-like Zn-dependent dehydrogenase
MALNDNFGNATMRGIMYRGVPEQMTVEDIPMPTILNQTDAIVRITTAALCGSDLHVYRGYQGGVPPWNMGHEAIGYVFDIGSAVSGFDVGDYVIIPDTVNHGQLEMEPTSLDFYGNGAVVTDGLQCRLLLIARFQTIFLPYVKLTPTKLSMLEFGLQTQT